MDALLILVAFSTLIWYIIDRAKSALWNESKYSKYFTMGSALILSAACVFSYNLDLVEALSIANKSIVGQCITVLIFMSGSSGISEIITKVRGNQVNTEN